MSEQRKEQVLKKIIDSFIAEAQPIASGLLAASLKEQVSPATVRNDMAGLERDGFIFQPHTSAGRIPTEKAYRHYVSRYLDKDRDLSAKESKILRELQSIDQEDRLKLKNFAKAVALLSGQGVMVAFSECDNYYTGLSNIFSQPEFNSPELVINLSSVIEHMDSKICDFLKNEIKEPEILIGSDNPFGCDCSLIVSGYRLGKYKGVIALLGPMRMKYEKNYALIRDSVKLLGGVK